MVGSVDRQLDTRCLKAIHHFLFPEKGGIGIGTHVHKQLRKGGSMYATAGKGGKGLEERRFFHITA